jgi:hypothetical protein
MSVRTAQKPIDQLVSSIVSDHATQDLLNAHGLKAHSVTWEDTGRSKGSCWGPNISDMTLVVKADTVSDHPLYRSKLMPVIRKPNFSDVTQDVPIDTFKLRVGNETTDAKDQVVPLKDYLRDVNKYVGDNKEIEDMYLERDEVILTSSQCCVLPVKKGEKTQFAVQLFNYQSYNEDPAVLVILVTKDGTSTQILQRSNQKLFFNKNGKAHWFSVERLEDSRERRKVAKTRVDSFKEMKQEEKIENTIMMIQVPLKQKPRPKMRGYGEGVLLCCSSANEGIAFGYNAGMACQGSNSVAIGSSAGLSYDEEDEDCEMDFDLFDGATDCRSTGRRKKKKVKGHGMDMGQIGLGDEEGDFIGTGGNKLVRDTRFPIRCTFQYYRVTDENFVSEKSIVDIAEQIAQAATIAVAQGSLVLNDKGERVTEPVLDQPKASDCPHGKLGDRDYLPTMPTPVQQPNVWMNQNMAGFV